MDALPPSSRRSVLLASAGLAGALSLPSSASAAPSSAAVDSAGVVDLPLGDPVGRRTDGTTPSVRTGPMRVAAFSMLGVSWHGAGGPEVRVRWRSAGGWTGWQRLPRQHDAPDAGTEGYADLGSTSPHWTGPADGVDVEVSGSTRRPVLHLVDPGPSRREDHHHPHQDVAFQPPVHHPRHAPRPPISPRSAWGADERWRNGGPYYNRTMKQMHVHHTASGNGYRPDDVPAILRGIYRYHTHTNGWSDIAYNFLVDAWGRIWEGRYGGVDAMVRGAHTLGFNHDSTGVAVIGNLDEAEPHHAVLTALVQVGAWKLDKAGRTPSGWTRVRSKGSDDYPSGEAVDLPVIDGHRDTNQTECPGEHLYERLGAIRGRAQTRADRYNPHDGR